MCAQVVDQIEVMDIASGGVSPSPNISKLDIVELGCKAVISSLYQCTRVSNLARLCSDKVDFPTTSMQYSATSVQRNFGRFPS